MTMVPDNVRNQVVRRGRGRRRVGSTDSDGMHYLESLPRRIVTVYLPLAIIVFVLLFPFYWMGITTFKSNEELYNFREFSPFWVIQPTLDNIQKLFFETSYPTWLRSEEHTSELQTLMSISYAVF